MKKIISILLSMVILIGGIMPLDFTVKEVKAANSTVVRGALNGKRDGDKWQYYIKSYAAASDGEKSTIPLDMSTKASMDFSGLQVPNSDNPFIIMELVPWQGFCEMGYMIEGCEPIDIFTPCGVYDKKKAAYYRSLGAHAERQYNNYRGTVGGLAWANMGSIVKACFPEEDYPGKGVPKDHPDYKYRWLERKNGTTLYGYYEKVAGTAYAGKGLFNITGLDSDGNPTFAKVEEGAGEFIWVSLGEYKPLGFDDHIKRENKKFDQGTALSNIIVAYAAGDRCYTQRTDDIYYSMGYMEEDGTVVDDIIPKSKFVHYNDFLRYSLRLRTQYEVDNFSVLVKSVDSQHLNANPAYIDYADLIYVHSSSESGIANLPFMIDAWENKDAKQVLDDDLLDENSTATKNSTFYTEDNDISWDVAERLYFKANGLTKYEFENGMVKGDPIFDYSGSDGGYGRAPLVLAKSIIDSIKTIEIHKDPTWYIDYDTMTLHDSDSSVSSGCENNFYKFCLMNCLMDQDVFYDLFYTPQTSTHQPVIQTINGRGCNTAQEGDAQTFWCPEAFLPYVDGVTDQAGWGTDAGKAVLDQYKIHYYNGGFMNFPGEAILSYTYIYNSDNNVFGLASNVNFDSDNPFSSGIHAWFEANQGEKASLSRLDVMYYLLNYQKVKKPLDRNPNPSSAPTQTPAATQQPTVTQEPIVTQQSSVSKQDNMKKPAKVVGMSVKAKKKKLTVSWKKKLDADGYQLQYALNKRFAKKKRTMNTRSHIAVIRGLKKNKIYYVRIRAYKKVSGKKVYGKWSKIRKIKTKL